MALLAVPSPDSALPVLSDCLHLGADLSHSQHRGDRRTVSFLDDFQDINKVYYSWRVYSRAGRAKDEAERMNRCTNIKKPGNQFPPTR